MSIDSIAAANKVITVCETQKALTDFGWSTLDGTTPAARKASTKYMQAAIETLSAQDSYNTYQLWKEHGRTAIAINPDLYNELTDTTLDNVPGEVLWTLPYRNPMVVFPHQPILDVPNAGPRRLLGMLVSGLYTGNHKLDTDAVIEGGPDKFPVTACDTHDRGTTKLRLMMVTEVLDDITRQTLPTPDYEIFRYTVERNGTETFANVVDAIHARMNSTDNIRFYDTGEKPGIADYANRATIALMLGTGLSILYYLCSTTLDVETVPRKAIARRTPKNRKPIRLITVGWHLGPALSRKRRAAIATNPRDAGGVGRQQRPHQRRAHFSTRWCGKGRTELKTVFIAPTWIHPELLDIDKSNTMHATPKFPSQ